MSNNYNLLDNDEYIIEDYNSEEEIIQNNKIEELLDKDILAFISTYQMKKDIHKFLPNNIILRQTCKIILDGK